MLILNKYKFNKEYNNKIYKKNKTRLIINKK